MGSQDGFRFTTLPVLLLIFHFPKNQPPVELRLLPSFIDFSLPPKRPLLKMQALRLARTSALRPAATALVGTTQRRCLATATANHVDVQASAHSSTRVAPIPLSNVEAHWERLSSDEKVALHEQLELVQQKDWKELSLDEKKAGAYKFMLLGVSSSFGEESGWY